MPIVDLHSLWDTYLLAEAIRDVPQNYSDQLPQAKVEDALRGAIYDPYIRRVLHEGIFSSWTNDIPSWLTCPKPMPSLLPTCGKAAGTLGFLGLWQSSFGLVNRGVQTIMSMMKPKMGVDILSDGPDVCPYYWAQSIHPLNCDVIWPVEADDARFETRSSSASHDCSTHDDEFDEVRDDGHPPLGPWGIQVAPLIQLSPKYSAVIRERMIVEKLLAQGGIRLAGVLNYIFAPKDDEHSQGLYIMNIDD